MILTETMTMLILITLAAMSFVALFAIDKVLKRKRVVVVRKTNDE